MKKLLIIPLLCLALTGCSRPPDNIEDGLRWMECVDKGIDYTVIRHRQTGVCYLWTKDGMVLLVNADGTPYTMGSNNGS